MPENTEQKLLRYRFADFLVDVGARTLFHGAEPLAITARVFDTLVLLLERAGAVVEREEFFRRVWRGTVVEDGNLTQAIFVLRKLLGDPDQRIIVTLPGRGYMFTAPVETIQGTTAGIRGIFGNRPAGPWAILELTVAAGLSCFAATSIRSRRAARAGKNCYTHPAKTNSPPVGRRMAATSYIAAHARETNGDIWVLPLDGTSKRAPVPLVHTRANEGRGTFSPDARWIAYVSDDSGIAEVYVQPFILPSASVDSPAGPKVLVSRKGGRRPRWRADGKELFYNSPDGALMSVTVTAGATFRPGIPQLLFRTPAAWFSEANATSDGTRFLVAIPVEQTTAQPFTVVLNWQAELAAKK